jgi:very-short-patch-repair endonuclease
MAGRAWELARKQHWVVARWQLLELGFHRKAIEHRLRTGRLYAVHAGVYAVGRRALTQEGRWMAAILACGANSVVSHESAAQLLGILEQYRGPIHISLLARSRRKRPGLTVHSPRDLKRADTGLCRGIPVTSPIRTLIDLATRIPRHELEAAVNRADKLDLVDPETLRVALGDHRGRPGVRALRELLDRHTFRLTDSELERRLLRIVRRAGLPLPETQVWVGGYRVDAFWPDLGLVLEADSLRHHRTAAEQREDRRRDQAHAAAGLERLRVTHHQVRYEPSTVSELLAVVITRLERQRRRAA